MIPTNASKIIDSAYTTWTLNNGVVYQQVSGASAASTAAYTANVTLVLYYNGTVYQENKTCLWWSWSGTNWVATSNPAPSLTGACPSGSATPQAAIAGFGVKVSGNKIVSTKDGSVVHLRGANVSGLEEFQTGANAWPNYGMGGEPDFASMAAWNMNVVRFPLNEANWSRYVCAGIQPDPNNTYQATVEQAVADANAAGLYVILDLHWAAPGTSVCPTGQGSFADADHSVAFWSSVAAAFKGNPAVIFELFNEPFGDNVWNNFTGSDGTLLRDGGSMGEFLQQNTNTGALDTLGITWNVAGFNELISTIRATGATNVVLAAPIGWAGEIEMWEQFKPTDSAGQLAVAWHVYGNHNMTAAQQVLNSGYPIVVTETNGMLGGKGSNNIDNQLFDWADAQDVGYLWWGWTPYSPTDDLDVQASCSASGAFHLTASNCGTPTAVGSQYKSGLVCAVSGAQNCW
jgi:aryl-phospho-beta-D-glucosidase BglC (GH1 family)